MKKVLAVFVVALCFVLSAKELRVLAIGNSFSVCVTRNLPQMVASVPGNRIILTSAAIGGCSLERHWNEWSKAEKDAKHAPYGVKVIDSDNISAQKSGKGNVNDLLKNNKYDIITIQQNSANSWKYATYQPYAEKLIAVIKKYQPQAEIVIQQTWSYRSDAPRLKKWKINNTTMFEKLSAAYAKLAKENGFRVIPTGYAVQIFRAKTPVKFVAPDMKALEKLQNKEAHAFDGEVVGYCKWMRNRKNKEYYLGCDRSHLNPHGEYMQAAVWFSFLFGEKATAVKYIQPGMKPEQAKFLLECAQEAVSTFKQPGK